MTRSHQPENAEKIRRPSPLQRNILIVQAGLEQRSTDRARTHDLEKLLPRGDDRPMYGNNLRASCRRMEQEGWVRTLRPPNLQLAVELTYARCTLAITLLTAEQVRVRAEQRAAQASITTVADVPLARNSISLVRVNFLRSNALPDLS